MIAMPTRLQIAAPDIFKKFEKSPHVLTRTQINEIVNDNRNFWRLAAGTTINEFIHFLQAKGKLKEHRIKLPYRPTTRYTWGDVSALQVIQSLRPTGYFTHYTAMQLHGLTDQVPKTVYLNSEQRLSSGGGQLDQDGISRAFRAKCRVSKNAANFNSVTICVLNGQNTRQLGVIEFNEDTGPPLRVTNVERTLIDITVRPIYSGGVSQVAEAFAAAQERVSVNRIAAYLRQLNFTYPYHQAIGYYLDRCGKYSEDQIGLIRKFEMTYDFYLTHGVKQLDYVPEWKLYVPKGF